MSPANERDSGAPSIAAPPTLMTMTLPRWSCMNGRASIRVRAFATVRSRT
jgi:hypothetical protein